MFKIYGVTDTEKSDHKGHNHDDHAEHHETDTHNHDDHSTKTHHDDHHHIDVDIHDGTDHETDVGQIAVDILDATNSIVIIAPIAGVNPADIDIGLSRNILTISGNRKEFPIYLDARRMLVEECFYGAFSRSIILPENLGFDEIKATVEHNVIIITIPKLTLISKTIKVGN
ncbi:Hsp20/alpha crystallin family protein [Candidatus Gracilibacteria bacterium]|nr:Hsp20/alpha crystallin family protein [Candidatus Gracilibacteria bacterium]